jgi:hypothetical protein
MLHSLLTFSPGHTVAVGYAVRVHENIVGLIPPVGYRSKVCIQYSTAHVYAHVFPSALEPNSELRI